MPSTSRLAAPPESPDAPALVAVKKPLPRADGLYAGARWTGVQKSGRNAYDVEVVLKHFDLEAQTYSGYLKIEGLTEEYPALCTCFEAEMVGSKFGFLTRKWDANEQVDRLHWSRFPAFEQFKHVFNKDDFKYDARESDYLFCRWKELFLVPDHGIKTIAGASFAGFYYVCFNKREKTLDGFYYHKTSELFQTLNLKHVPENKSGIAAYEFR